MAMILRPAFSQKRGRIKVGYELLSSLFLLSNLFIAVNLAPTLQVHITSTYFILFRSTFYKGSI